MTRLRIALASAALLGTTLTPTFASANDIGFGIGLSYVFGSQGGLSVGVKAFSNDEDNETVGSLGLDYVVQSGAFRPNLGVSYQGEGYFSGADVGYNLGSQSFDFGVGAGWSNSDDDHKTPAPAPEPLLI